MCNLNTLLISGLYSVYLFAMQISYETCSESINIEYAFTKIEINI